MQRVVSALGTVLCLASAGCIRTSDVDLSLLIRESVLDSVDTFPVRVVVDMGIGQNRELQICDWSTGFLETKLRANSYPRCPEPFTIEALVVPLRGPCEDGIIGTAADWPDEAEAFGKGSLDIFQDGLCSVTEDRQLNIDPME